MRNKNERFEPVLNMHNLDDRTWSPMMRIMLSSLLMLLAVPVFATDNTARAKDVSVAIDRGLGFLAKDALAWKEKHNCHSCHHAAMVIWAMNEAKQRGHAPDEVVLADMTKWVAESGAGTVGVARP